VCWTHACCLRYSRCMRIWSKSLRLARCIIIASDRPTVVNATALIEVHSMFPSKNMCDARNGKVAKMYALPGGLLSYCHSHQMTEECMSPRDMSHLLIREKSVTHIKPDSLSRARPRGAAKHQLMATCTSKHRV